MHTETQAHTHIQAHFVSAKCTQMHSCVIRTHASLPVCTSEWICICSLELWGEICAAHVCGCQSFLIISPEPYVMDSIIKGTLAIF